MQRTLGDVRWTLGLLLGIWAVVFLPIVPLMVQTWLNHSDNSHALLVPLISGYFLWQKRDLLWAVPVQSSTVGIGFLTLLLLIYLISFTGGIAFITRLTMVGALISLLWGCFGGAVVRQMAFPLGFLFFMVPVPDTLLGMVSFPLQLVATKVAAGAISLCSIPVYREGNMLFFVGTQLEVAEACSGIRSLMSLTMLSLIFVHLSTGRWLHKIALILSAVPIALLANILRITGTGILAHFYGDQVARGFLHDISGLLVLMIGLVLLFATDRLLKRMISDD